MNVVEVIPILRGLPKSALTYFSGEDIRPGQFVEIEVHGQSALGLVTRVVNAQEVKTSLKRSGFALKKLVGKKENSGISPSLAHAAERTAVRYAATTGAVLGSIIPKLFLEEPELLCFNIAERERTPREPMLIQLETPERFATYRSIVRERFAKGESVLFLTPSNELARRAFDQLSSGIEDYTHLFTLAEKKKSMRDALKLARMDEHPVLFITTPSGLVFDRSDLSTVIIEAENSPGYRTRTRPYISYKTLVEALCRVSGKELIIGDTVLSVETLWKEKEGAYVELTPLKWRVSADPKTFLIDMKRNKDQSGKFEIFSPELKMLVGTALLDEDQIFLYGARKGLAPTTVCGDCGNLLACPNCGAPMVLHKKSEMERIFACHACGATRPSETKCDICASWKLVSLGIGVERIKDEAQRLWPDAQIFIFDKDHVETAASARSLAKKIRSAGPAIIIGTELYMLYREEVPHAAVVSMDSLFAIPDFGIHERIFSLVTRLREMSTHNLLIQTRNIGKEVLEQASKGDILGFYRAEIADRRAFSYPPFTIFIKGSIELDDREVNKEASMLKEAFTTWNPDFMRVRGKKAGRSIITMVMRMPRGEWPDAELSQKLSLLGSDFTVKVDPESIL